MLQIIRTKRNCYPCQAHDNNNFLLIAFASLSPLISIFLGNNSKRGFLKNVHEFGFFPFLLGLKYFIGRFASWYFQIFKLRLAVQLRVHKKLKVLPIDVFDSQIAMRCCIDAALWASRAVRAQQWAWPIQVQPRNPRTIEFHLSFTN